MDLEVTSLATSGSVCIPFSTLYGFDIVPIDFILSFTFLALLSVFWSYTF